MRNKAVQGNRTSEQVVEATLVGNAAPVASDATFSTPEDTPATGAYPATDADDNDRLLNFDILRQPEHGTATNQGGSWKYVPDPDFSGTDSFTFRAFDDKVSSNEATITINVDEVNDAPTASLAGIDVTFTEDGAAVALFGDVTLSAVEPGQDIRSVELRLRDVQDGDAEILTIDNTDVPLGTDGTTVTENGFAVRVTGVLGGDIEVLVEDEDRAPRTAAEFETLLESLSYHHTSQDPTPGARQVVAFELVDAGIGALFPPNDNTLARDFAAADRPTVTVEAVNDPPEVTGVFGETSVLPLVTGLQNVALFDDAGVADPDSADFDGGSLVLLRSSGGGGSWGLDGAGAASGGDGTFGIGESVQVGGTAIGTVALDRGGVFLSLDLGPEATPARVAAFLQSLTYAHDGPGEREFILQLDNGDGSVLNGSVTIVARNADPVNTLPG